MVFIVRIIRDDTGIVSGVVEQLRTGRRRAFGDWKPSLASLPG